MPTSEPDPRTAAPEPGLRLKRPDAGDGTALWQLAADVGLDLNSPYAYVLWGEYFAQTSVVATRGDEYVGFVIGFRPPDSGDSLFVWQIGVADSARRTGLGASMLDHLLDRTRVEYVEATVTPENDASAALFRSLGKRHGATVDEADFFAADLFPRGHQPERLFRIGPIVHTAPQEKCL